MDKPIKSRQGLTRCRGCRAHIEAGPTPSATTCPFCGANLLAGPTTARAVGRGGLLAASLLALSAAGCGGSQAEPAEPNTNGDTTVSSDDPPSDPPDQYDPQPADDNQAVAEYGVAIDEYEQEPADTPRPTPRYGLPPRE